MGSIEDRISRVDPAVLKPTLDREALPRRAAELLGGARRAPPVRVQDRGQHILPAHPVRIERRPLLQPAAVLSPDLHLRGVDPLAVGLIQNPYHPRAGRILASGPGMETH